MIVIGTADAQGKRPVTHNRIQTNNYFLDESINSLVYYVSVESEYNYFLEYEGMT